MGAQREIAIVMLDGLSTFQRNLTLGIADFARTQRWRIFGLFVRKLHLPRRMKADGAIVFREHLVRLDPAVPCVHVGASNRKDSPSFFIDADPYRIGELAAEHMLESGLRVFSCAGDAQRSLYCLQREEAFRRRVARAGAQYIKGPDVYALRFDESRSIRLLARWIAGLPKPIGLMGVNDVVARQLADACNLAGCPVPDQAAIVGVGNDELMCRLSDPPLSSIDPAARQVGYQAAATLARLMDGEPLPDEPLLVPPAGLSVRQSSDLLAIEDPDVAHAVRFIRDHCTEPITINDVLEAVPVARRSLDRRFRQRTGRTMRDEIQQARIRRARELLTRTTLPIPQVATQCGFSGREYFTTAFRRIMGISPGAYRRQFQVLTV